MRFYCCLTPVSANPATVNGVFEGDHFEEGRLSRLVHLEGAFNGRYDLVRLFYALAVHAEAFHHLRGAEGVRV